MSLRTNKVILLQYIEENSESNDTDPLIVVIAPKSIWLKEKLVPGQLQSIIGFPPHFPTF